MQDIEAVIRDNIGLVITQLKRLKVTFDHEAESIGYEALYNAALTYDCTKGYKFSTYATCCIYNAVGSYIRTLNKKRQLEVLSYNNITYNADGQPHEFLELLSDNIDVEEEFVKQELLQKVCDAYQITYDKLTNEKHKAIISTWHDADYCISNKEIADIVGVSQPYVNQVINTFKHSLRKKLEVYYYG